MTVLIGVSLKAYFGYQQTLAWCRQVAIIARGREDVVDLFVVPAFPALPAVAEIFRSTRVRIGAQDLCADDAGARTGEVGGAMLAELGCRYAEVGHAERRRLYGETEDVVAAKLTAALRHGLVPVLCIGEADHLSVPQAAQECRRQIASALAPSRDAGLSGPVVVAYEPHWAIGAAAPASDRHIRGVCAALREDLARHSQLTTGQVIYGGSAGPGLLTRLGDAVDGLFLGRFAHDPDALRSVLDEAEALTGIPMQETTS
jgi:triosephosphate isomerase (TIM)